MPHNIEHRKGHIGLLIKLLGVLVGVGLIALDFPVLGVLVLFLSFFAGSIKMQAHYRAARKMLRDSKKDNEDS